MKNNAHSKFRESKEWKMFCILMRTRTDNRCECCGIRHAKGKGLNVHHKNPSEYENLENTDDFAVLCYSCHREVERLAKRLAGKNAALIIHKEEWLALYGAFLPKVKESK